MTIFKLSFILFLVLFEVHLPITFFSFLFVTIENIGFGIKHLPSVKKIQNSVTKVLTWFCKYRGRPYGMM